MKERTILPFRTSRLISRCGRFNLIQHNLTFVEALSLVAKVPVLAARIFRNVFMEGKHAGMPISGLFDPDARCHAWPIAGDPICARSRATHHWTGLAIMLRCSAGCLDDKLETPMPKSSPS